jgi:hypothetical protein
MAPQHENHARLRKNGYTSICAEFVPATLIYIYCYKFSILTGFLSARPGSIYQIFDTWCAVF